MAVDFSVDIPVVKPWQVYAFADYLAAMPSPATVVADLRLDADQYLADLQDVTKYPTDPTMVRQYFDGRCNGEGRYPLSQDTGDPADTELIECATCSGFGYTATQAVPVVSWPTAL